MVRCRHHHFMYMYVLLVPPSDLGAWAMTLVLWLPFECYYYPLFQVS